jgi:hypothetical protein
VVEYWGSKDTEIKSEPTEQRADDKGRGSIIITNDNRHVYPQTPQEGRKEPSWAEKGTLVILTCTFLAAIYAGYEANRLANLTETAVSDSETTATRQATDTTKSLELSKEAADAATIANRAWISPRYIAIESVDRNANSLNVRVLYDNAGKTPARDVSFHAIGRNLQQTDGSPVPLEVYRNAKLGENQSCAAELSSYAGVVYPASNQVGNISYFTIGKDDPNLIEKMMNVRMVVIIQGCFKYRTLDVWHKSTFCSYLEPDTSAPIEKWQFKNCGDGADAD